MISGNLTAKFQIGIILAVGLSILLIFMLDWSSDPQVKARNLVPDDLVLGEMISGHFGKESGAALFKINGSIPNSMESFEASSNIEVGRISSIKSKSVPWTSTAPNKRYTENSFNRCTCFACARSDKVCEISSEWLKSEDALFYISKDPNGVSYILNRRERAIIVVWNRSL